MTRYLTLLALTLLAATITLTTGATTTLAVGTVATIWATWMAAPRPDQPHTTH